MNNVEQVLFVIVTVVLALLLILLIAAAVYAIKILRQVRRITERAETVASSVESAADMFASASRPLGILKLVARIIDQSKKSKSK